MLDLEQHSEVLYDLYVRENKTLKEIMLHMEINHEFKATSAQYQAHFKKNQKFQKNLKKNDWAYVERKLTERGSRESAVYHHGVLIPFAKVKKNTSRHVHPNDAYKPGSLPPSPGNIVVRSPSPAPVSLPGSPYTSTHRRRLSETSIRKFSSSKRQQLMVMNDLPFESTNSFELAKLHTWRNAFYLSHDVDLSDLPCFRLQDMFNSEDVKRGFEQLVTLDDPLCGKIIHNFWSEPRSQTSDYLLSDSSHAPLDMGMGDDWGTSFEGLLPEPKPMGIAFVEITSLENDSRNYQQSMIPNLTNFLENIPYKSIDEAQALTDLLLGPPTVEAVRRFVEVGVYIISNHLDEFRGMDTFIETLLQRVSWSILRPILSVQAPSIQAFAESVFLYAISSQRTHVVEDLLPHKHIKATVISNGSALVSAVRTSNYELVSLILGAGACPNKQGRGGGLPLTEARDAPIAQLLREAGADVNASGQAKLDSGRYLHHVPAVITATASKNIDLLRYLIRERADVNMFGWDVKKCFKSSAVMVAVEDSMIEVLKILLQSGARPNETSMTRQRDLHEIYPLQEAARLGDIEAVQLLIKYGGNVNAPARGRSGMTALQAAVSRADIKMTKLLLGNHADVNVPVNSDAQYPRSVLTTAVEMNHLELVEIILDASANSNVPSYGYYGFTALESAICFPSGSDIYGLLIARGAQHRTTFDIGYRQTQLRKAVLTSDLARVGALLGTGLKVDMQPFEDSRHLRMSLFSGKSNTKSILQDAIIAGSAVFQVLFELIKNYDKDIDFHPLLIEAILAKNVEIQTTLLEAGANINSTRCQRGKLIGTPLMFAVSKNDLDTVRFLHDNGADINMVVERFEFEGSRQAACTALQVSLCLARYGEHSLDIFHFLRQHGAIINARIAEIYGFSELTSAVQTGNLVLVQELLDDEADVNNLPAKRSGRTALQAAADLFDERIDIVQSLLQSGADVNAPPACEYGITALGAAAVRGYFQITLILLEAGADVNAEFGRGGANALTYAVIYGRLDMVHLLLKAGADLHLPKYKRYVEAAAIARIHGYIAIATLLDTWKADEALERSIGIEMS